MTYDAWCRGNDKLCSHTTIAAVAVADADVNDSADVSDFVDAVAAGAVTAICASFGLQLPMSRCLRC